MSLKIKAMADLINCVFEVKSLEDYDQECKVLSPADFIESLNDLEDGELIGTEIDRNKVDSPIPLHWESQNITIADIEYCYKSKESLK